jgi:hypothetical protein
MPSYGHSTEYGHFGGLLLGHILGADNQRLASILLIQSFRVISLYYFPCLPRKVVVGYLPDFVVFLEYSVR